MEEKVIGLEWIQESGKGEGEENVNVALQGVGQVGRDPEMRLTSCS